ncbi:NAD(P)-binding domain-containing protein [uncultured Tolumonas sp.]|uniref:NADPH-dependent F420 reductase n=1 Tax=uncultured Tolumonas sp. TaxID=263765 RepID=UPI002A0A4F6B|nr:NAD(P)-binding domain-containing protein [uncultured Tolumonas sp.]
MNIGIIGAGNIGATLARKLTACGHIVKLANSRGPETIYNVAREIGATAVTREEAVRNVDVIILSIPFGKYVELTELLAGVPNYVTVIDTSNYYPARDGYIPAIVDEGKPESVWASELIGRPLIKAWNAVLAATLAGDYREIPSSGRIAIPIAGDNDNAKSVAMELVRDTGFDAIDAGTLENSWRQQPGTPAYCTELNVQQLKTALVIADKSRSPRNRDSLMDEFMSSSEPLTHEHIIARNRAVTA